MPPRPRPQPRAAAAAALALPLSTLLAASLLLLLGRGVGAQELEEIQAVVDEIMKILCFEPCAGRYTGNEVVPGTKCQWYHECKSGRPVNIVECGDGLWFNPAGGYCDVGAANADCPPDPSCPPTPYPTESPEVEPTAAPTGEPSDAPTREPIKEPTPGPTPAPAPAPTNPPVTPSPTAAGMALRYVESRRDRIERFVLVSYDVATGVARPSTQYTFDGLLRSLQLMGVRGFGADFQFSLWEYDRKKWIHGLVNLAAFLANSMVEAIERDACDEWSWQEAGGNYPISSCEPIGSLIARVDLVQCSNSCGQEGRSYEDENCPRGTTDFMACDADANMYVTAVTSGTHPRAPPPLKCRPGGATAGYWNGTIGREVIDVPFPNVAGRVDTAGCCWWGRGALLTRGVCNVGKINYFLGKGGADAGRYTLYPTIDFCRYPEATCASANGEELRWTTALFEWAERVQRYEVLASFADSEAWSFEDRLTRFVEGDLTDDGFITDVSRILSRGCHKPGCSGLEVRMLERRKAHFLTIIDEVFDVRALLNTASPTTKPVPQTPRPSSPPFAYIPPTPPLYSPRPQQPTPAFQPLEPPAPSSVENIDTNPDLAANTQSSPGPVPEKEFESGGTILPPDDGSSLKGKLIGLESNDAVGVPPKKMLPSNMLAAALLLFSRLCV
ncbi:hypothetical protein ACHAWF_010409 [Thalassiosira exigua]